jgi:3'-phosphoadenosine 5'-phosphosulfate sulfotransferase (PAPS reductase)/FAD synthetase
MKRCRRCILSADRPDVHLNGSGLCDRCEAYENDSSRPALAYMDLPEFSQSLEPYRLTDSRYNCLVLFTGGRDSTYLLHLLSSIDRFRVLAVTMDCWFTSPQTQKNITQVMKLPGPL